MIIKYAIIMLNVVTSNNDSYINIIWVNKHYKPSPHFDFIHVTQVKCTILGIKRLIRKPDC